MQNKKTVIIWLFSGCLLIFLMVVIGGITRLTDSGLSMSSWKLIGSAPPISIEEWTEAFDIYKTTPEGKINSHYILNDFKNIYFWEYLHRMMGRLLGIVFLISYVIHHATHDTVKFGDIDGNGLLSEAENIKVSTFKYFYYFILISHILLSAIIIPLVLVTWSRALKEKFEDHKKIARITFPIWLYVSATGVLVYILISPYY